MGTGALFTAIYRRYDLIICWTPSNGTVQRLSNALATGVPVIARRMPTYEQAFGSRSGILLASGLVELQRMAQELKGSASMRGRVSEAGAVAARQFSRGAIASQYRRAIDDARARIRGRSYNRTECAL